MNVGFENSLIVQIDNPYKTCKGSMKYNINKQSTSQLNRYKILESIDTNETTNISIDKYLVRYWKKRINNHNYIENEEYCVDSVMIRLLEQSNWNFINKDQNIK